MKKPICLLLLVLMFTPAFSRDSTRKDYSDAFRLAAAWLEAQSDYDRIPGISVAVVHDQEFLWTFAAGYANAENRVPAETGTLYSICSISKLFTSVAIMKLYDEGRLRLDDRIEDLLPWYGLKQRYPESGPVTVRSLLTHSSGLPRESNHAYWTGPDFPFPTREAVREGLFEQETLYPASSRFQYSNLGMSLLGEVVSEVSGMPYEAYIEQNILEPLRLRDTRTYLPEEMWGTELATGYSALQRDGTRYPVDFFQARGITPAAGFSSTVEDLARFASWQFRLLENGGIEILKASTLREMQRVHWTDPDWKTTWGLGFSVYQSEGRTLLGHSGSCPGYRSILVMDPQAELAWVVMINAQNFNPWYYAYGIRKLMQKISGDCQEEPGFNAEDYAGRYNAQPWAGEICVQPWEGKLAIVEFPALDPASAMSLLKHQEGDVFRRMCADGSLAEEVVFERDKTGRVSHYLQQNNLYKRLD